MESVTAYELILRDYPDIMTCEQMCEALCISTKTGYRLIRENHVQHIKVGRAYRIAKIHILAYLRVLQSSGNFS